MDESHLKKILPDGAMTPQEMQAEREAEARVRDEEKMRLLERGPLTVAMLREALKDIPDDMVVFSEGCDCIDHAYEVDLYADGVAIKRLLS